VQQIVVLVCAMTLALGGCSNSGTGSTADTATPITPDQTTAPEGRPTPTDPAGTTGFNVYFTTQCPKPDVQRDPCLVAVGERRFTTEADLPTAAVLETMNGPNAVEASIGMTGNIAKRVQFQGVEVGGDGTATVRFNRYFETAWTRPQVAQIVYTLTQFPEVDRVKFLIDGEDNGATGVPALTRADVADRTPPLFVDTPWLNAQLGSAFTVSGSTAAASTALSWQVLDPTGAPMASGDTTSGATAPGTVDFEVTLPVDAAGPSTFVVKAADGTEVRSPITIG
jgi:hypothetical protein